MAELAVPRQVAVIGVDNDSAVAELAPVPLSSVDSARERAGYEAAALFRECGFAGLTRPPEVAPIADRHQGVG